MAITKIEPTVLKTFYSKAKDSTYQLVRPSKGKLELRQVLKDAKGQDSFVKLAEKQDIKYGADHIILRKQYGKDGKEIGSSMVATDGTFTTFSVKDKSLECDRVRFDNNKKRITSCKGENAEYTLDLDKEATPIAKRFTKLVESFSK